MRQSPALLGYSASRPATAPGAAGRFGSSAGVWCRRTGYRNAAALGTARAGSSRRQRAVVPMAEQTELEQAIAEVKRQHGRESMSNGEVAPHLPEHLRQPFWEQAIDRYFREVLGDEYEEVVHGG